MGTEYGGVPGKVVKVVHDDGDEQVEHNEGAEKNERDKVDVGNIRAASLVGVEQLAVARALRLVPFIRFLVAGATGQSGQHDLRPGLASGASAVHKDGESGQRK